MEPMDFCRACDKYFTLSELRKHVTEGDCKMKKKPRKRKGKEKQEESDPESTVSEDSDLDFPRLKRKIKGSKFSETAKDDVVV